MIEVELVYEDKDGRKHHVSSWHESGTNCASGAVADALYEHVHLRDELRGRVLKQIIVNPDSHGPDIPDREETE